MNSSTQPLLNNSKLNDSSDDDTPKSEAQRRRRQICLADASRRRTCEGPTTGAVAKLLNEDLSQSNKVKNGSDSNLHKLRVMNHPNFRKLSESRGIQLPIIEMKRSHSAQPGIESIIVSEEYSPVTQVIKFAESISHDRSSNSQSFIHKSSNSTQLELLDIRIFFSDGSCVQFTVEGGSQAQASDLLHLMAEHLEIPEDAANSCFALWLISPLLEVQLKPQHVAAEVRNKWPSFLKKYTMADEADIALDEPLLVLRRNVSLTVENEREWEKDYEQIVDKLYLDAKDEYLTGRYLVEVESALELAALQVLIEYGPYEEDKYSDAIYLVHDRLSEFVSAQHLSHIRSFQLFGLSIMECKHGLEKDVVQRYKEYSQLYQDQNSRKKAYLDILRSTPFYGAAFFMGRTERRSTTLPLWDFGKMLFTGVNPSAKMSVRIGIQSKYITVVDPVKSEILLTQRIEDCSWLKSEIAEIPEFFLHFPDPEYATRPSSPRTLEGGENIFEAPASKLLQIFSKQAYMMVALLDSLDHIAVSELGSAHDLHNGTVMSDGEKEVTFSSDEYESACSHSDKPTESVTSKSSGSKSSRSKSSGSVPASFAARRSAQHINTQSLGKITLRSGTDSYCSNKLSKLCLATLDPKGCCVEAQGSLKKLFVLPVH